VFITASKITLTNSADDAVSGIWPAAAPGIGGQGPFGRGTAVPVKRYLSRREPCAWE